MKQIIAFVLFLFLSCSIACGSKLSSDGDRSDMSQWIISDVLQDRQGFIWFSTWNGLNRYDGYSFQWVKTRPGDGTEVRSERIRKMILSPEGNIWCRTDDEVFQFDVHSYRYSNISPEEEVEVRAFMNTSHKGITDSEGNEWDVHDYDIYKVTKVHNPAQCVEGTVGVTARAFLVDNQNRWWVATKEDQCVRLFDQNNQLIGYLSSDGSLHREKTPLGQRAYSLFQTHNGDIWIGCKPGALLRLREVSDGRFNIMEIPSAVAIYDIAADADGRLWFASFGGGVLCCPDPEADSPKIIDFMSQQDVFSGNTEMLRHLLITSRGTIICTSNVGLVVGSINKEDVSKTVFRRVLRDGSRGSSLSCNTVCDVVMDYAGNIFVSTNGNGIEMTTEESLLSVQPQFCHFCQDNSSLTSDACLSMALRSDRHLFVAAYNRVMDFDPYNDATISYASSFWNDSCRFSEARPVELPDGSWLFGLEQGAFIATRHHMLTRGYQPPLVFTSVSVCGSRPDMGIAVRDTVVLGPDERNLDLSFAALDYTDNSHIRYRTRLNDNPWSSSTGEHRLSFIDLRPGSYLLEVQSTDRYGRWVDNNRTLTIVVEPRWHETWWAALLLCVAIMAIVAMISYVVWYVRKVNRQRREILEKYLALINQNNTVSKDKPTEEIALPSADQQLLNRVRKYIEENISNSEANIDDMASVAATSSSSLNRRLRSLIGITAAQLLIDSRMQRAKLLLEDPHSRLTIGEIAYSCGYTDPHYFSRCFKQKFGSTPTEFRENRTNC